MGRSPGGPHYKQTPHLSREAFPATVVPPTSARCCLPCAALVGEDKQKMVKSCLEEGQKSNDSPHLPQCTATLQEQPFGIIAVYLRRSLQNERPKRKILVRCAGGTQIQMKRSICAHTKKTVENAQIPFLPHLPATVRNHIDGFRS